MVVYGEVSNKGERIRVREDVSVIVTHRIEDGPFGLCW